MIASIRPSNPKPALTRRRIVMTTAGSLGDLHPYLAIAIELRARGHEPVIASLEYHRQKVERNGIGFHPIQVLGADFRPEMAAEIMHASKGPEFLVRGLAMPSLRQCYQDITAVAAGCDLLVSHPLTLATPLVAHQLGIPWVDSVLAPLSFLSAYDPPVLAPVQTLKRLRFFGPALHKPLFGLAKWSVRAWCEPLHSLRAELGLPPAPDPMFQSSKSASPVLAMFSREFAGPQPDWPPRTMITGFPFFDEAEQTGLAADLERFLSSGPPPIVFTLGSAAVMNPGTFYEDAAAAAKSLSRRAVLLTGDDPRAVPACLPEGIAAFAYAPFSALFPRAAAIVHPGGIGTTAQAMRAGVPMLVVPHAFDQFDNAERVRRRGIGRIVQRQKFTPQRVAKELRMLLADNACVTRAAAVGAKIRAENGVVAACGVMETLIQKTSAA
jgi:rhamnosyltransferase subunit B